MRLRQVLCHVRLKKVKATRIKVLVFVHLMALSVIYFSYRQVDEKSGVFRKKSQPKLNKDEKVILYWTTYFGMDDFSVGFGHHPFRHCPVSNCRTTNDRSQLDQSDAVVFHIRDIDLEDLPSLRFPHQRWIFYLLESPYHTPSTIDYLGNKFNWTMTYRTDSDVQSPYGLPQSMIADRVWAESYERAKGTFNRRLTNLLSKKNNTIAWVVSHCNTSSGREKYVEELKQYINVDIYGQCSDRNCSSSCFETLGQQYKFYLSFENSLCRDYVTEKFYNPLFYNMIPIVYGSADYSRIPELSSAYIDTRNFVSVKDLADYLHYLDKNDRAYQKYFKWRRKSAGLSVLPRTETAWCNLCQKLVQSSTKSLSTYRDMYEWWNKQAKCKRDDAFLEQT